ncbi:hypothetical protein [Desulfobulbus sp.]|uniref:hypothetical protein n=1 Tax=Desulfobulbus sp. TaxID=895 RepID=UPI00286F7835|nr:hypothetical protein [Desulfobulbus sp.]
MLITIAEMMGDTSIDPHYHKDLGVRGITAIGFAIDKLTEKITEHHEDIQDVLEGVAEAEHKAREDYLATRWKKSRP